MKLKKNLLIDSSSNYTGDDLCEFVYWYISIVSDQILMKMYSSLNRFDSSITSLTFKYIHTNHHTNIKVIIMDQIDET